MSQIGDELISDRATEIRSFAVLWGEVDVLAKFYETGTERSPFWSKQ